MGTGSKLLGTGILTALAASLCCITPVLALVAGTSSLATTFAWVEPLRPYLITITFIVIGFAWYQKLKTSKNVDCECEPETKEPFMHSKLFLSIVTCFTLCLLAFPFYAHIFHSTSESNSISVYNDNIELVEFEIIGMTCTGCEEHVNIAVGEIEGVISSITSYEEGNSIIEFDNSKTNRVELIKAIETTGYAAGIHGK